MNKVWLVTGSASGLGRNIAEVVLESGDRLVATTARTGHAVVNLAMNQAVCDGFSASESARERVMN